MESSPVREDVRFGEVFSTPTGNHRKRTNLVFNINNAGVEQVVGQYEEKLTPAKEIETAAERTRRKTANRGSKRSGIPSRRREQILTNSEGQRKRLLEEKKKEEHNEQNSEAQRKRLLDEKKKEEHNEQNSEGQRKRLLDEKKKEEQNEQNSEAQRKRLLDEQARENITNDPPVRCD
jgi:hypothetical protein